MSPTPLRFALIGAGGIAQSYLDVFSGMTCAQIAAVADPRAEARDRATSLLDVPAFADHKELLRGVDVDAALVCTPPSTHVEISQACVEQGVPTLCEKPFALGTDAARALINAAAASGVLVTMAAKFRYVADVVEAKRIVDSGVLGESILFENVFASHVDMRGRWNADASVSGGGVLVDNGTHSVDIARYFLGPIAEVSAVEAKRIQALDVEDTAQMFLRSVDGATGAIDLSWSIDKPSENYVSVYCSQGAIVVGWKRSRYRPATGAEWIEFGTGYDKLTAMRAQVDNFAAAVRGDADLLITADDAIASVDVVAAAYRSMRDRRWVPIRDPSLRSVDDAGTNVA